MDEVETLTKEAPREVRLREYNELYEQLEEFVQMDVVDVEEAVIEEAGAKLILYASSLNSEENIEVTKEVETFEATKTVYIKSDAPYEVHYDNKRWYPCVITEVIIPDSETERLQYKVRILGYSGVEECVLYEGLREWKPMRNAETFRSGEPCHAIHPSTHLYQPATIQRLNLEGDVTVKFSREVEDSEEMKVPLSHVMTKDQKYYPQLMKIQQLSESEKKALREERAQKKRERKEEQAQMKADLVAQDASDWQSLMSEMGVTKKRKKF